MSLQLPPEQAQRNFKCDAYSNTVQVTNENVEQYCDCEEGNDNSHPYGTSSAKHFQDKYECCPNAYKLNEEGDCEFAVEDVRSQIYYFNGSRPEDCEHKTVTGILEFCHLGGTVIPNRSPIREDLVLTPEQHKEMCRFDSSQETPVCKESCFQCPADSAGAPKDGNHGYDFS